ncbi:tetratricopeptide repeat protein, partial [Pseudoalteromonas aliena]
LHYPSMGNVTRDVINGFQIAYTFYLSALLYQSAKQYNDAYIDYKKALAIHPNNIYLQQDVMRLAKKHGFDEALSE